MKAISQTLIGINDFGVNKEEKEGLHIYEKRHKGHFDGVPVFNGTINIRNIGTFLKILRLINLNLPHFNYI